MYNVIFIWTLISADPCLPTVDMDFEETSGNTDELRVGRVNVAGFAGVLTSVANFQARTRFICRIPFA